MFQLFTQDDIDFYCAEFCDKNKTPLFRNYVLNSLAPGRYGCPLRIVIFILISQTDVLSICCESTPSDEYHETSLMISQHWTGSGLVLSGTKPLPESMLTFILVVMACGITRPQWVNRWCNSGSTLIMACCLNQCWPVNIKVQWHSSENFLSKILFK